MSEPRLLMSGSSFVLLLAGLVASFLPQELLAYLDTAVTLAAVVLVQIGGALYLGFAFLNWGARGVIVGGIYARPLAMGNFVHWAIGAITLLKVVVDQPVPLLVAVTIVYTGFAAWFGRILFTHPKAA